MYLLFDIGGTHTRIALSDGKTILKKEKYKTLKKFSESMQLIHNKSLKLSEGKKPKACVAGIAGLLGKNRTKLIGAPNLQDWVNKPLKNTLQNKICNKIFLENDAALAGLGEAIFGAGHGYKIVAFLTVSTGIGGVKIVNGKIDAHSLGFEPGQQVISLDGKIMKLENLMSGTALEKKYGRKPPDIENSKAWDDEAKYLAIALNNIIVEWSPDVVVLGGALMNKISLEQVKHNLKNLLKIKTAIPPLTISKLGDDAGLYGALEYLKQNLN